MLVLPFLFFQEKKSKASEKEVSVADESEESEEPLKRVCTRQQKDEQRSLQELPQLHRWKNRVGSTQHFEGDEQVKSEPLSPPEGVTRKSALTRPVQGENERPQPCLRDRREGRPDSLFPQTQVQDKGKKPVDSLAGPREYRRDYEKEGHIECLKMPKIEPANVNPPTEDAFHNYHDAPSIVTENKPFTNYDLQLEVPLAVIHPGKCQFLPLQQCQY